MNLNVSKMCKTSNSCLSWMLHISYNTCTISLKPFVTWLIERHVSDTNNECRLAERCIYFQFKTNNSTFSGQNFLFQMFCPHVPIFYWGQRNFNAFKLMHTLVKTILCLFIIHDFKRCFFFIMTCFGVLLNVLPKEFSQMPKCSMLCILFSSLFEFLFTKMFFECSPTIPDI